MSTSSSAKSVRISYKKEMLLNYHRTEWFKMSKNLKNKKKVTVILTCSDSVPLQDITIAFRELSTITLNGVLKT